MSHKCCIILIFLVIIKSTTEASIIHKIKNECSIYSTEKSPRVFLTISSLYVSTTEDGVVNRQLEVNWVDGDPKPGDKINVYNTDSFLHSKVNPIVSLTPHQHPGGFYRSNIAIPVIILDISHLTDDHCLGYWVAYQNNQSDILSSSCLRIQPFWMEENSAYLSDLTLDQVMIPGSHDSGSFYYRKEDGPLSKYKYAQDENIFNQMVYGLRYFDLRVGHYKKSKEKYYINHNFLRTDHSVKSVLLQVLKFIKVTKKEVVILDFHNFPVGFTSNHTHEKLMDIIVKILGPYLIPVNEKYREAPFSYLWKQNKRVLVSYDSPARTRFFNKLLWPSIARAWGNKQDPEDLKTYFEEFFSNPLPKGLWASMAELTPSAKTIILHPETGLRVLADLINRNVTQWFRDFYWHKANIVATDYFLGNNIIDVAIRTNRIKGACPPKLWLQIKP